MQRLLFDAALGDAEVVVEHVLDVFLVGGEFLLEGEGHLLAVDGEHGHALLEQPLVEPVVLEELELDEALDGLLEEALGEDLVVVELVRELGVAHHLQVQLRDLLELVAVLLLLYLRQHDYQLLAHLRVRNVAASAGLYMRKDRGSHSISFSNSRVKFIRNSLFYRPKALMAEMDSVSSWSSSTTLLLVLASIFS